MAGIKGKTGKWKRTEEDIERICKNLVRGYWKGKQFTSTHREKIAHSMIGKKNTLGKKLNIGDKKAKNRKISLALTGKTPSLGHRIAISCALKKIDRKDWNGFYSTEMARVRGSGVYKKWRNKVFGRDKYTCKDCGVKSEIGRTVYLVADHIQPFSKFPKLRFRLSNGRTLCMDCHKNTPTYGWKLRKLFVIEK